MGHSVRRALYALIMLLSLLVHAPTARAQQPPAVLYPNATLDAGYSSFVWTGYPAMQQGLHAYLDEIDGPAPDDYMYDTWNLHTDESAVEIGFTNLAADATGPWDVEAQVFIEPTNHPCSGCTDAQTDTTVLSLRNGDSSLGSITVSGVGGRWVSVRANELTASEVNELSVHAYEYPNTMVTKIYAMRVNAVQARDPDEMAPDVDAGGALGERTGAYVGDGVLTLDVVADDTDGMEDGWVAGVRSITVRDFAGGVLATRQAGCAPQCPETFAGSIPVDTRTLPEVFGELTVTAEDGAGNSATESVYLTVDRTAPTAPARVRLLDHDPAASTVVLDWIEGDDSALVDGEPGSGAGFTEWRRRGASGTWGTWQRVEDTSDALLQHAATGVPIAFELRSIDAVGNMSAVAAATLTPAVEPEPEEGVSTAQLDSCTPRIDYGRARHSDPDYHRFREIQTTLGMQLQVFCIITGSTDEVEITARLAYKVREDDGTPVFQEVGIAFPQRFRPRNRRDVKLRGFNADCEPRMGGLKEYIVIGTLKYIRGGAVDVTRDFHTDPDDARTLFCPSARLRQARRTAGWHTIKRYSVDYLTRPDKRQRRSPNIWLRDELGNRPFTPNGARPSRSWHPHHLVPSNDTDFAQVQAKLFSCRIHPNAFRNGVYLRWIDLRRTRRDGSRNPHYDALRQQSQSLADRTYHGDTFRSVYLTRVRDILSEPLQDERCPISSPPSPETELAQLKDKLLDGTLDLGTPKN
jgi:hypothetical protein